MLKQPDIKGIKRIIDANVNRAKEGLRVCEEITRFILESPQLTSAFKKIRHKVDSLITGLGTQIKLIEERHSLSDIGKNIYAGELVRKNLKDIFFANIQRAKESIRVLEEFSKLANKRIAVGFKEIRYILYDLEKKAAKELKK